jgi:release factor glutamine methyltransferase
LINNKNSQANNVVTIGSVYRQLCDEKLFSPFDLRELIAKTHGFDSHHDVLTHLDQPFIQSDFFSRSLLRLRQGEPIAYILGVSSFMGRTLNITSDVLIPRPETEELVSLVFERLKHRPHITSILDLGTGSGAIACRLKAMVPHLTMMASDVSERALDVARGNALNDQLSIDFRLGHALMPWLDVPIHGIVSNPPYILRREDADSSVDEYEPHLALYTTLENNLFQPCIDRYLHHPELHFLAFELNKDWVEPLEKIVQQSPVKLTIEWLYDLNRHLRFAWIERNNVQ